jgi:general secretion pathway protein D
MTLERSKLVLWGVVLAAAGVIIWRVGFHVPESHLTTMARQVSVQPVSAGQSSTEPAKEKASPAASEPNAAADAKKAAGEPNKPAQPAGSKSPADANKPPEPGKPAGGTEPNRPADSTKPAEPNKPSQAGATDKTTLSGSGEPMEAVNLKDVEMKNIIDKIAQWTGKTVIPHDEAMKQKVTIYAPEKLPRKKALEKIYSALRMKGYMVEESGDTIFLKPLAGARLGVFPTVGPDEPLAAFENKEQIVQKLFKLKNYPPAQMGEIVTPLVGEFGHVSADATTGTLLVIDAVGNLQRIEHIIQQFDVPEAGKAITDVVEIKHGDPSEIVQLLRMLLGESPDGSGGGRGRRSLGGRVGYSRPGGGPGGPPQGGGQGGAGKTGVATSVTIGGGEIPLVLIPDTKRKWIIVSGSADDVKKIREWVEKLDRDEPVQSEYETVTIAYADPQEVADRIEKSLEEMPGSSLRPSVVVQALQQSRQIMIFGRSELREMVKKLIVEVDIPAGTFLTEHFQLKHADPEQIKSNLDSLYGENIPRYEYYSYMRYGPGSRRTPADTVKIIAFPAMQQITVIAAPENMEKIRKQIADWDVPLNVEAVKPRIIELRNSDPVQMAQLLTKLFSEENDTSRSFFRMYLYGDTGDQRKKIVGPLYGQLTFEAVQGTKKIIVISKIPQAYDVIEQLVLDLDRQEMAESPRVIQVKYADTEDLAERLNAMFNEAGTNARIRRTTQGIGQYSMDETTGNQGQNNARNAANNNNSNNPNQSSPTEYTPWWSSGARRTTDEQPISNVIGHVRFVPDPRSKSILILAPREFQMSIADTIRELDVPGKQVMVKAVVIEIDHQDLTSLGVQLSSNPGGTFSIGENAVTAVSQLEYLNQRGATKVGLSTNITALIDFLVKKVNAQILNQQTLWTEDNDEASFFKGQKVAFQTNTSISETGGRATQSFEYQKVGMTLAVRPSITPEKNVDMIVTVLLSDLTGDQVNGQPVRRVMETTTNMIVGDGQTLMLGGILFQTDSKIQRKVPLLGDLPLVGGLFRHNDVTKANNELIIFITPYVVAEGGELPAGTAQQLEEPKQRLEQVQGELKEMSDQLEEDLDKNK